MQQRSETNAELLQVMHSHGSLLQVMYQLSQQWPPDITP
jgi:hypothetical protein